MAKVELFIGNIFNTRLWPFFPKLEIKENGSQLGALLKGVEKVSELRDVSFPSRLHRISAQHWLALT
jgi:hypothetical protein